MLSQVKHTHQDRPDATAAWLSRVTEGNTADVPISYDQPCPCAGNTLSEIILYACSVSVYTVHSITTALLQYAIFHISIFNAFISLEIIDK